MAANPQSQSFLASAASASLLPYLDTKDAPDLDRTLAILARSPAPLLLPLSLLTPSLQSILARHATDNLAYLVLVDQPIHTSRAADLLDNGALALVITADHALPLIQPPNQHDGDQPSLPANRVVLRFDQKALAADASASLASDLAQASRAGVAGALLELVSAAQLESSETQKLVRNVADALDVKRSGVPIFLSPTSLPCEHAASSSRPSDYRPVTPTLAQIAHVAKQLGASVVTPVSTLGFSSVTSASSTTTTTTTPHAKLDFVDSLLVPLTSDRADGLWPTTVVASSLGTSLGLVYSSAESIRESILTGDAVYQSRKRGLWRKGETSGATQQVVQVNFDCDNDAVEFRVRQRPGRDHVGFCHLASRSGCFGGSRGLAALEATLQARKRQAPAGSYTARLFSDPHLLSAKLREEAAELADARDEERDHVAFEAADLLYFALARCVRAGVSLEDVERSLDRKALKVVRRKGDAKPQYLGGGGGDASAGERGETKATTVNGAVAATNGDAAANDAKPHVNGTTAAIKEPASDDAPIKMVSYRVEDVTPAQRKELLKRPGIKTAATMELVRPTLQSVRERGDAALLELTAKFDRATLTSPVQLPPFVDDKVMARLDRRTVEAIDQAYANIYKFHAAQKQLGGNRSADEVDAEAKQTNGHGGAKPTATATATPASGAVLEVETMPGVVCRRFARPIQSVGLYVPGGSAVLPSTALMLGVPAQVAGCPQVVLATPPRPDGSVAAEVLYAAHKVGASCILKAGGAQAVAAMAYGTESVPKVDKILGPGNQYVTAAKMLVQNDTDALVSIDMPAGPSEVLVICDAHASPDFVASDLLSQAEHGPDSQVVLVAIGVSPSRLAEIESALDRQARTLPRRDVVRKAIEKSLTVVVSDEAEAVAWSNDYAPEHLIIQTRDAESLASRVVNAGSIFVGAWSPESCGDYASGTNHSLPTYGLARQYSGVSVSSFEKHITSQRLTRQGLEVLGPHVVALARAEKLEAHARAVEIRLEHMASGATTA